MDINIKDLNTLIESLHIACVHYAKLASSSSVSKGKIDYLVNLSKFAALQNQLQIVRQRQIDALWLNIVYFVAHPLPILGIGVFQKGYTTYKVVGNFAKTVIQNKM